MSISKTIQWPELRRMLQELHKETSHDSRWMTRAVCEPTGLGMDGLGFMADGDEKRAGHAGESGQISSVQPRVIMVPRLDGARGRDRSGGCNRRVSVHFNNVSFKPVVLRRWASNEI